MPRQREEKYDWATYDKNYKARSKRMEILKFLENVDTKEELVEKLMGLRCNKWQTDTT